MTHVPPARPRPRRPTAAIANASIGGIGDPMPAPDLPSADPLAPGPRSIAGLDAALPLTLFPVRIATRFHRPDPEQQPTQLWIRIFPDVIHADGHIRELTDYYRMLPAAEQANLHK